jgi:hypothetical protein
VQTAAGAPTLQTLAGVPFPTIEPARSTVASDGSVWTASNFSANPNRVPQSRLVRYDPATGKITGQDGVFLGVRLNAVASNGPVASTRRRRRRPSPAESSPATRATAAPPCGPAWA